MELMELGAINPSWSVSTASNGFVTSLLDGKTVFETPAIINPRGVTANWANKNHIISVYFNTEHAGEVLAGLILKGSTGSSTLQVSVHEHNPSACLDNLTIANPCPLRTPVFKVVTVDANEVQLISCGEFVIPRKGYMRMDIQGLERDGPYFAEIYQVLIVPRTFNEFMEQSYLTYGNQWGLESYYDRKGSTPILRYKTPEGMSKEIEYFHTNVKVSKGQGYPGSNHIPVSFNGGSLGLSIGTENSQRGFTFTLNDTFTQNDPKYSPDTHSVQLIKSSEGVEVEVYAKSTRAYLKYHWVTGNTYKLMLAARPENGDTIYTAWFNDPSISTTWTMIASFRRKLDSKWLGNISAYNDNTLPSYGNQKRGTSFGDQWFRTSDGVWTECSQASYSSNQLSRKDVVGAVDEHTNQFVLQTGGFFNPRNDTPAMLTKLPTGIPPQIDIQEFVCC